MCGVVYGTLADGSSVAYNWYLHEDGESVLFFDPIFGKEYTVPTLMSQGFKLSTGLF